MNIERVTQMEERLDNITAATKGLDARLMKMQSLCGDMSSLFSYYGSEEWYEDRDGEIPQGVKAGVLSEDAVYDAITDLRDTAFSMIDLATDILKNRIG